jgi:hypothetical protein
VEPEEDCEEEVRVSTTLAGIFGSDRGNGGGA